MQAATVTTRHAKRSERLGATVGHVGITQYPFPRGLRDARIFFFPPDPGAGENTR